MLYHIVLFKLKKEASPTEVRERFLALDDQCLGSDTKQKLIVSIHGGVSAGVEGLEKGFDIGFTVEFNNAKDRDEYLIHKDHQAFSDWVKKQIDDILVFDFEN